jgi:hypothetical protein
VASFGKRGTTAGAPALRATPIEAAPADDLPRIAFEPDTEVEDELRRWKAQRRAGRWNTRGRWAELAAAATLGAAVARLTLHGALAWPLSFGLGGLAMVFGLVGWTRPRA